MNLVQIFDNNRKKLKLLFNKENEIKEFREILACLDKNPTLRPKSCRESVQWLRRAAKKFQKSRSPMNLATKLPETKTDPIVEIIFKANRGRAFGSIKACLEAHKYLMAAENKIGSLLEEFVYSVLKENGWIWCSGSLVKSVDFIRKDKNKWTLLQLKNRDNSENSSSSRVRDHTPIKKWYRFFSKTAKTNWENFPDNKNKKELTEEKFQIFVKQKSILLK